MLFHIPGQNKEGKSSSSQLTKLVEEFYLELS